MEGEHGSGPRPSLTESHRRLFVSEIHSPERCLACLARSHCSSTCGCHFSTDRHAPDLKPWLFTKAALGAIRVLDLDLVHGVCTLRQEVLVDHLRRRGGYPRIYSVPESSVAPIRTEVLNGSPTFDTVYAIAKPVSKFPSTLVTSGNILPVASIANLHVQHAVVLASVNLPLHPNDLMVIADANMRFLRMSFVRIIRLPSSHGIGKETKTSLWKSCYNRQREASVITIADDGAQEEKCARIVLYRLGSVSRRVLGREREGNGVTASKSRRKEMANGLFCGATDSRYSAPACVLPCSRKGCDETGTSIEGLRSIRHQALPNSL